MSVSIDWKRFVRNTAAFILFLGSFSLMNFVFTGKFDPTGTNKAGWGLIIFAIAVYVLALIRSDAVGFSRRKKGG